MTTPTYRIRGSQVERENVPQEWLERVRPELGVQVEGFTPDIEEASRQAEDMWTLPPGTQEFDPRASLEGLRALLTERQGPELPEARIYGTPSRGIMSRIGENLSQQPLVRAAGTSIGQAMLGEMLPFGALLRGAKGGLGRLFGLPKRLGALTPEMSPWTTTSRAAERAAERAASGRPRITSEIASRPPKIRATTPSPATPPSHMRIAGEELAQPRQLLPGTAGRSPRYSSELDRPPKLKRPSIAPSAPPAHYTAELARQAQALEGLRQAARPDKYTRIIRSSGQEAITDPRRLLPALGDVTETGTSLGQGRLRRPEQTTLQLVQELLQRQMPGARATRLSQYPKPPGSGELERAIRQRAHISESMAERLRAK